MKRIYTLIVLCAFALTGFQFSSVQAQAASLEIIDPPSTIISATTDDLEIAEYLIIKNNSSSDRTIQVRRDILQLAPNHESIFCFGGVCLPSDNDFSITFDIKAGEKTSQVNALNPKLAGIYGNAGTSKIRYTIFDVNNPEDKISVEFTYIVSAPTDVQLPFDLAPVTVLSNAFPSPAYDNTRIDYNIAQPYNNATITLYSLIGNPISTFRVDAPKGNVTLQTGSLAPGVYFYSIVADGKKLATKKLVVKR